MRYRRWHNYGRERVYLTADDGVTLGFIDRANRDTPQCAAPDRLAEFHAGVDRWLQLGRPADFVDPVVTGVPTERPRRVALRRNRPVPPANPAGGAPSQPPGPPPAPTPAGAGWTDLALHRPGQGVAAVAAAHRQAHPLATRLDRLRRRHTDAQAWVKGAAGEKRVGQALHQLTGGDMGGHWEALHAITVNAYGGDIDHLLIGPPGVFTINAKNHPHRTVQVGPQTLSVDGRDRGDYLRHAVNEAETAATALSLATGRDIDVWAIVVFVGATVTGYRSLDQVLCLDVAHLAITMADYALSHQSLDDGEITGIYSLARRDTTWPGA